MDTYRPTAVWLCACVLTALALMAVGADAWGIGTALHALLVALLSVLVPVPGSASLPFGGELHPMAGWGLAAVGGAALTVFLILRIGRRVAFAAAVLLLALGLALSWWIYARYGLVCDTTGFAAALAAGYGGALIGLAYARCAARIQTARVFCSSMARPEVRKIVRNPGLVRWTGDMRTITTLFCTLRRPPDETIVDPVELSRQLHTLQLALTAEILARGGYIDCVAGGFAAYWNAPLDDSRHASHACEAACAMMAVQARMNEISPQIDTGIGLATGAAICGGYSRCSVSHYGVAGACVALSARMQRISIRYGAQVLVCEETRKAAGDGFAFLDVDYRVIDPDRAPVRLYVLLGDAGMRASPKFRALQTFHELFAAAIRGRQWHEARELITQCRRLSGAIDGVYDLHLRRIDYFEKYPPAADWDGAFRPPLI